MTASDIPRPAEFFRRVFGRIVQSIAADAPEIIARFHDPVDNADNAIGLCQHPA